MKGWKLARAFFGRIFTRQALPALLVLPVLISLTFALVMGVGAGEAGASDAYAPAETPAVTKNPYLIWYNYGNSRTGIFRLGSNGQGGFAPQPVWYSDGWDLSRTKSAKGLNGDLAAIYDYGNANTGLFLFEPMESGYNPVRVWLSGPGSWELSHTKLVVTDLDGDNASEVFVLYNYGNANTGIFIFVPNGSGGYDPHLLGVSGPGNWDWFRTRMLAINNDYISDTEVAFFYDYGDADTELQVVDPNNSGFGPTSWQSGPGNFEWSRSKFAASDTVVNNRERPVSLYNYGNSTSGIITFNFDEMYHKWSAAMSWFSGPGNWDWSRSRLSTADIDADGNNELVISYDYGNAGTGIFVFDPAAGYHKPEFVWFSGFGNWEWGRSFT